MNAKQIQEALPQFTGSTVWTKWNALFPNDLLTEGACFIAEECSAYWLMDIIASWQYAPMVKKEPFQCWTLSKSDGKTWKVTADDGNGKVIATQDIESSNFKLPGINLWAERNERGGITILLPTEH